MTTWSSRQPSMVSLGSVMSVLQRRQLLAVKLKALQMVLKSTAVGFGKAFPRAYACFSLLRFRFCRSSAFDGQGDGCIQCGVLRVDGLAHNSMSLSSSRPPKAGQKNSFTRFRSSQQLEHRLGGSTAKAVSFNA
eukprot:5247546-Amphidinium_carterae.1